MRLNSNLTSRSLDNSGCNRFVDTAEIWLKIGSHLDFLWS